MAYCVLRLFLGWGIYTNSLCYYISAYGTLTTGSTNKEFSFRHDWNSLISDDESLQMKHYTKDYFPHADVYVSFSLTVDI